MKSRFVIASAVLILTFNGCSSEEQKLENDQQYAQGPVSQQLAEHGADLFRNRRLGEVAISCADCHNDFPDSLRDERIMPGHSVLGVVMRRATWYGEFGPEDYDVVAAGAAKCAFIYQLRGDSPNNALTKQEASSLMAFYSFISTGNESRNPQWNTLSYPGDPNFKRDSIITIVDSLNEIAGDPVEGEALFQKACAFCHSNEQDAIGPSPRSLRKYYNRLFLYVRAGRSNMPFFSYDKLTDQDVADIREWIERGAR